MVFDRKTVETYFEKFSTTTVIRVFNFIRTSSFGAERLFWIAVLIGFSSLTVWSVTQTFETFLSESTVSRVTYCKNHTTGFGLRFSGAGILLQMRHEALRKHYQAKADEAIADLVNGERDFAEILKGKMTKVHEMEDRRIASYNLSTRKLGAADPAVADVDCYHSFEAENAAIFTQNEIALFAMTTSLLARLIDVELNPKPLYPSLQSESPLQKLLDAYMSKGADFNKLFDLVAEIHCVLLQIRVVIVRYDETTGYYSRIEGYNLCKHISTMAYFDFFNEFEVVAYQLGFELAFYNHIDVIVLSAHTDYLYRDFVDELTNVHLTLEKAESTALQLRFNAKQTVEFRIDAVSVSANLRRRECAMSATHAECAIWCRVESLIEACNCKPLYGRFASSFQNLLEGLESCPRRLASARARTVKCQAALAAAHDTIASNCSRRCLQSCVVTILSSVVREGVTRWENANASTVIVLKTSNFIYPKVEEQLAMTTMTLVAAIGGNLSLYLGASFLALIHIVVFFVKLPFEARLALAPASDGAGDNSNLEDRLMEKMTNMRQELIDLLDKRCPDDQSERRQRARRILATSVL